MRKLAMSVLGCLGFVLLVFGASYSFAQSEAASLSGRVVDPSEAAVPDARMEATNTDTNITTTTYTNKEGLYSFPSLKPGRTA